MSTVSATTTAEDLMPQGALLPSVTELSRHGVTRDYWPGASLGKHPRYRVWIEGVMLSMRDDKSAPRFVKIIEIERAPNLPAAMAVVREIMPKLFDPQKWVASVRHIRRSKVEPIVTLVWLGGQYERAKQHWDNLRLTAVTGDAEFNARRQRECEEAYERMTLMEENIRAVSGLYQEVPVEMCVVRGRNVIRRARMQEDLHV